MQGEVLQIFIAPERGAPMEEIFQVHASPVEGLAGDRYGKGKGSYSTVDPETGKRRTHRDITLIAQEAIDAANAAEFTQPVLAQGTRRNIVTQYVDLNALLGKKFQIGNAVLRGTKLSEPCQRPPTLAGWSLDDRRRFETALENCGGLCAEVVEAGFIDVGAEIIVFDF